MSVSPRSRAWALTLSVLPGWGHVYWGRELLGLFLFTIFTVSAFAVLNASILDLGRWRPVLLWGGVAGALGAAAWAWTDIFRRTDPERLRREGELRERELLEGMIAYVRGDHPAAKARFLACVRRDSGDVEALFRLGMACARSGETDQAIRWLERARRWDLERKWDWEVRGELARLRSPPPARGGAGGE